ncbi:MAG: hypothetical protein IPL25_11995 [Saprospiraceae bacterium]|nr:hypothetical protein [Candidatus Vicinibacter affinis]
MNSNGYTDKFLFNVEFQDGGIVTCAGSTNGCFSIGRCCKEELPQTQRTSQPKSKKSKKLEAKKIVIDKSRKKKFPPPIQTDPWPGPADPQLPQKPYDPLCSDCIPIDLVGGVFDTVDFGDCHGIWCDTSKWITMTLDSMPDPCIENLYDVAEANAYILYEEIIDSIESAFLHAYNMKCLQAVETFNDKAGFAHNTTSLYTITIKAITWFKLCHLMALSA